jgi:hypothetical protein
VDICRISVQSQTSVAAAEKSKLLSLCGTAVEAPTLGERRGAAEAICLGLIGATSSTPEAAKKVALKDCKTNAWD